MNSRKLVEVLCEYAAEAAVRIVEKDLQHVTGRKPPESVLAELQWFKLLRPEDQQMVLRLVKRAVDATLFEVFAVFDGVKAIPEPFRHGEFLIKFADKNGEHLVSRPSADLLHEHYRELHPFE